MPAPAWDPRQYLRFADQRTRPLRELLARVPEPAGDPARILDLGCGPGNSTAVLRERWPGARITGVDSSPEMLDAARTEGEPNADYLLADLREYDPAPTAPDLITANALLQWLPGHLELLPRWVAALRPGGTLALQVPGNFEAPSHTLLAELCRSPRWRDTLGDLARTGSVHQPAEYLAALAATGAVTDAWETTYSMVLSGPDPVLAWTKGTALRPVLTRLAAPADREAFTTEYAALLREAYPATPYGTVFPFRRIFAVATRS